MKSFFRSPWVIYSAAGFACSIVMISVDYLLGTRAEILNAWVIVNRILGFDTNLPDSLALQYFGLRGATLTMLAINGLFGVALVHLFKWFNQLLQF
ncbi:hypothetical protein KFE98_15635 [bacterium SCSIO 12741]|nr:hypothetical protein KFE98_15635 [bacterium SCSIO 12741]